MGGIAQGRDRRQFLKSAVATSAFVVAGASLLGCGGSGNAGQAGGAGRMTRPGAAWGEGWSLDGPGNLRKEEGLHLLQGGSDVYPHDPRVTAFAMDRRFLDGAIEARFAATGVGGGVALRRRGPYQCYMALFDAVSGRFQLIRKTARRYASAGSTPTQLLQGLTDDSEQVLGLRLAPALGNPVTIRLEAQSDGAGATDLRALLRTPEGAEFVIEASDDHEALQQAGDAGIVASAVTATGVLADPSLPLVPSAGALLVTDQGAQIMDSPVGDALAESLVQLSTVGARAITIDSGEAGTTVPSVIEATTGRPLDGGVRLGVISDVPAEIAVEIAPDAGFSASRRIPVGPTNAFNGLFFDLRDLPDAERIYWRPVLQRNGVETTGPARDFRNPPPAGDSSRALRMVVSSCATEFNQSFGHIAAEQPDIFVWEGDLNYPDADGPLAQTVSGYAGLWKDFLWTPQLRQVLDHAMFVAQRDDHDYGKNDIGAAGIPPRGIQPWEGLMNPETYFRFDVGTLGVWVLDQRRFADDNARPDGPDKTLIGVEQREWLLDTLAASPAPFKLICSPMPFYFSTNNDTGWSGQFAHERGLILDAIRRNVTAPVLALTGDAHSGAVIDTPELLEIRASPLDIPIAGWKLPSQGEAVVYSDIGKFYTVLQTATAEDGAPALDVQLVRIGLGVSASLPDEAITNVVFERRLVAGA